jgi:hypothetical protein
MVGDATLRSQPAVGLRMGKLFVRFERTTLAELIAAARVGAIERSAEGHASSYFVCLTEASALRPYRVWIMSDAEMGGPDRAVTEVVAESGYALAATGSCPQIPSELRPVSLDRGLWLGSTAAQLRAKLGVNSGRRGEWLTFNYLGKVPGKYGGSVVNFDVTNTVEARLRDGRVDGIAATRMTTY